MKGAYRVVAFDLADADFSALETIGADWDSNLLCIGGDVTKAADWTRGLAAAIDTFGQVDVLFNNAGISGANVSVAHTSEDEFDHVMNVNVKGVFLGLKIVGSHMKTRNQGVIINTSSISGERGGGNVFSYTTSKHAVNGMTKSAAVSLARFNVRVLAVCPCPTGTEMMYAVERKIAPDDPVSAREGLAAGIPMKRYGEAEEIADVVAFLASSEASFMTGALVPVDGGTLAN